jgi:hypothetical protein
MESFVSLAHRSTTFGTRRPQFIRRHKPFVPSRATPTREKLPSDFASKSQPAFASRLALQIRTAIAAAHDLNPPSLFALSLPD